MSYLLFIFQSAIEDFRRNKIRTALTSLGILIGVASVILLISFGLGLKKYISGQFDKLGTNKLIVMPGKTFSGGGLQSGGGFGGIEFDERDVEDLKKLEYVKMVVPTFMKTLTVTGNGNSEVISVQATTHEAFPSSNMETVYGSLFEKGDLEKRKKVAVLGPKIAQKIFGDIQSAVGKSIKIQEQNYKVLGVLKALGGGGFGGPDFDSMIYVPYKSAYSFNPNKSFYSVDLTVDEKDHLPTVKRKATALLAKKYKEDEFSVVEMTEILNTITSIFAVLNSILVAISAISLLVGGIGIMNIMYISVVERTKEIGIRRSMGALKSDISIQFLAEAVFLSFLGGAAGLALAFIVVLIMSNFFPAYIDLMTILIAIGISSAIGILFGVFPARRAANLSPIEAIRYE